MPRLGAGVNSRTQRYVKQTAMSPSGPKEPVVERQSSDGQSDDLTGRTLRLRIRQQELLAELGVLALQGTGLIEMLNHTARLLRKVWGRNTAK
jgi:hypothetical protein